MHQLFKNESSATEMKNLFKFYTSDVYLDQYVLVIIYRYIVVQLSSTLSLCIGTHN